jgi:hypothetical protein
MNFSPKARPPSFPEEIWTTAFNHLSQQIRQYFVRPESHQQALAYSYSCKCKIQGLGFFNHRQGVRQLYLAAQKQRGDRRRLPTAPRFAHQATAAGRLPPAGTTLPDHR